MIGWLRGRLMIKQPPHLMIEVNGIGYELEAPMSTFYTLSAVGTDLSLFVHQVVREDAHLLFGFATEQERRLFRELLKVSNVGPRIGLALLSGMSVEAFLTCVESNDVDMLVRVPGVGRKTAERLVIEMRDRVKLLTGGGSVTVIGGVPQAPTPVGPTAEAFAALVALGYKPAEVTRLLKSVDPEVQTTEEIIRRALQAAAKRSA
ncbi:MAG: Holliday junction branch migration protein RuvA [Steroidobacteraceae bacterium]